MQRTLHLHSLKFVIEATGFDPGDWIDRLYSAHEPHPGVARQGAALTLSMAPLDAARAHQAPWPAHAVFAENNLCCAPCFYADGIFYAARDGDLPLRLEYHLGTGLVLALVGGLFLESGHTVVIDLLRPILQSFILPFHGLKSLHGAVLHGHGRTLFLDGPGGAGKTTTALMLARAGYDLLSDDGPLFVSEQGHTSVVSSRDFAHLTEGTVQLFPELTPGVVGGKDSRGKFSVNLRALQPSGALAPLPVTHYIRLRRGPCATPRLVPLDRSAVLRDLVDSSLMVFRPTPFRGDPRFLAHSQWSLHLVGGLVRDATPYALEFADHHLPNLPAFLSEALQ